METLRCKTQLSNLSSGSSPFFMLKPEDTTEMAEPEFLAAYASALGWSQAKARFALDAYSQVILDALSANRYVNAGPFTAKLAVKGSLDSMTAQPTKEANPVVANIRASGNLAARLRQITVVNAADVIAAAIYELMQDNASGLNRIENTTDTVIVTGTGLQLNAAATDEGVWLADPTTGVVAKTGTVNYSDHGVIKCKFTTLPVTGQYRFTIATRDGDPSKSVRTLTRLVQVVNG